MHRCRRCWYLGDGGTVTVVALYSSRVVHWCCPYANCSYLFPGSFTSSSAQVKRLVHGSGLLESLTSLPAPHLAVSQGSQSCCALGGSHIDIVPYSGMPYQPYTMGDAADACKGTGRGLISCMACMCVQGGADGCVQDAFASFVCVGFCRTGIGNGCHNTLAGNASADC